VDLRDFESILICFSEEEIEKLQAAIDERRSRSSLGRNEECSLEPAEQSELPNCVEQRFSEGGIASCSSEVKGVCAFLSGFHPLGFPSRILYNTGGAGSQSLPRYHLGLSLFIPSKIAPPHYSTDSVPMGGGSYIPQMAHFSAGACSFLRSATANGSSQEGGPSASARALVPFRPTPHGSGPA
jgi:hypothetical protein